MEDFQRECVYLELTFLRSGYPLIFVDSRVSHFFGYFHAETVRYSSDQAVYDAFRRRVFAFVDQQRQRTDYLQKLDDDDRLLRFEYLYEVGPRCKFNQRFRQLWSTHFSGHPVLSRDGSKVLLATRHRYSLNALLAQHQSFCWIHK